MSRAICEWTMADQAEINGLLLLLAPALAGPSASSWDCVHLPCVGTVWALCTEVPSWPPVPVTGDNFSFLGFSALSRTETAVPLLSQTQLHCTHRHPILQNLSRERRIASLRSCITTPHPPHTDLPITHPPPHLTPYYHSTLSLAACPSLVLFPPFASSFSSPSPKSGPAGDGTDLTGKSHVWLAQQSPPPPSFMPIRAIELTSIAQ